MFKASRHKGKPKVARDCLKCASYFFANPKLSEERGRKLKDADREAVKGNDSDRSESLPLGSAIGVKSKYY
jgi:hypothetical protein